jgi:folylpolyglutamate synthase/dihydrofolate synthase
MSVELRLDRIQALSLHFPPYTRPTCHIAGTNGKGSVSALLSSIFSASSLKVGRFNSPHLITVRDCIVIGGKPVDAEVYASARVAVELFNERKAIGASLFEILTLTALVIFEAAQVDVAVIEVGMGGRLDATNVIDDKAILVSALTSVDLDHTAFLGPTVKDIAKEKAGIARAGKVFLIGEQKWDEVTVTAKTVAESLGAEVLEVEGKVHKTQCESDQSGSTMRRPPQPVRLSIRCFPNPVDVLLPLRGEHQISNLAVAVSIVDVLLSHPSCSHFALRDKITPQSVAQGIGSASWPGRLSWHTFSLLPHSGSVKLDVLVDGAHNAAAAESLSAYVSQLTRRDHNSPVKVVYILALSDSPKKSASDVIAPLITPHFRDVALVEFGDVEGMPWVKSVEVLKLRDVVRHIAPDAEIWCPTDGVEERGGEEKREPLLRALEWASTRKKHGEQPLVVIAGSLYLVADFYRLLARVEGSRSCGLSGVLYANS